MPHHGKFLSLCILLLLAAAVPGVTGCGGNSERAYAEPAKSVDKRLVEGNTEFAFNLYRLLTEDSSSENIFISPASISLALAMTYNGAAGETRQAMEEVLGFKGMSLEEINKAFADLNSILLNPDPKVELAIANSLWFREGVAFNEDFLQRNSNCYGAEISALDFKDAGAAAIINDWVKRKTRGKIEGIVEPPIDPDTILFLINAIYFKGEWTQQFDPRLTREMAYHLPGGSRIEHPVMFQSGVYRYLQGEGFQAVSLPYGKNERVSMYLFLPDKESSLHEFQQNLTPANWQRWMSSFAPMEGDVGLPKFKFEYEASLKEVLSDAGMKTAFNPAAADFSGMRPTPPELYISDIKHKAFVEANEEGTEAAAVTSVEISITSMPVKFNLLADRPFFFSIVDNKTGSILFMGSVSDPR